MIRTRWRFGLNRLFVATIEWLRLWPNAGARRQTWHTLDTAGEYIRPRLKSDLTA